MRKLHMYREDHIFLSRRLDEDLYGFHPHFDSWQYYRLNEQENLTCELLGSLYPGQKENWFSALIGLFSGKRK